VNRSSRQKISNEIVFERHIRSDGHDRYIQNITSKNKRVYILSSAHGAFSRIDHMLGHKTSLNKFKKTEIISCIFSDHSGIKLAITHKKKLEKNHKHTEAK